SVELVISKLMAKKPEDRYQTAAELIADLERIERGDTLGFTESVRESADIGAASVLDTYIFPPKDDARRTTESVRVVARRSRNGWVAGGILGIVLVAAALIVIGAANGIFARIGLFASATPTASETLPPTNTPTITPSLTGTVTVTASPTAS